jgi:hypothetical protein
MASHPETPIEEKTPAPPSTDSDHEEDLLDEALEETFPASDPISLMSTRFQ